MATLNFLKDAKNVLIVRVAGVGKTHLVIAIGLETTNQRRRVKFIGAKELILELIAARQSNTLSKYLEKASRIELLIIDEIGYFDIQKESASPFFRLISKL